METQKKKYTKEIIITTFVVAIAIYFTVNNVLVKSTDVTPKDSTEVVVDTTKAIIEPVKSDTTKIDTIK